MLLQKKSKKRTKREVKLIFINTLKSKPAPEPADKAKPAQNLKAIMHALTSTTTLPAQK
jgi:hypothetical protein